MEHLQNWPCAVSLNMFIISTGQNFLNETQRALIIEVTNSVTQIKNFCSSKPNIRGKRLQTVK